MLHEAVSCTDSNIKGRLDVLVVPTHHSEPLQNNSRAHHAHSLTLLIVYLAMFAVTISLDPIEFNITSFPKRMTLSRTSTSSTISSTSTLVETPTEKAAYFECAPADEIRLQGTNLSTPSVTAPIKALLAQQLATLSRPLRIVGLLATRDRGCHQYATLTAKNCSANGILFDKRDISSCRDLEDSKAFDEVKQTITEINVDGTVDGVIVYFPLFGPELVRPIARYRLRCAKLECGNRMTSSGH